MSSLKIHEEGPGLKVLGTEEWYGGGYCGVCGHTGDELVARAVRFWDPDDGWKVGVLCMYCGPEVAERGPKPDDFAYADSGFADFLDTTAELLDGDLDCMVEFD